MADKMKFSYLYGPVASWRLGSSLGIDPISKKEKICSYGCVYCQLGVSGMRTLERKIYIPTAEIIEEVKQIPPDVKIDYITLSGRGEPTLAENLGEIIKAIRRVRNEKIAVITNASLIDREDLREELGLADLVMAKLDAADQASFEKVNKPVKGLEFEVMFEGIREFSRKWRDKLAIQMMFLPANRFLYKELAEKAYDISPREIQINTPLRECGVKPLSSKELDEITAYFKKIREIRGLEVRIISVYEKTPEKVKSISAADTLRRRGKKV